ncbi:unnamed protein product [Phaedon cochleariae]|uniref:Ig-like domain-containing protein n=1 Tax=Phaedon cochleariae TaxID=80249 RepID=A0A9N9SF27_PHACE|nr:unnamed protein product [Phaedon cochleariae]
MIGKLFCGNHSPFVIFLVIYGILDAGRTVKINRLQVPEVAQLGDPLVLDCDYTVEESLVDGLVVKWFFNEKPTPIYQWIPNKRPQELGIMKGRLNLNYSASEDRNSVHRALHIIQPGTDLSGNYTCMVSTFRGEDVKTKRMLVLVPEKTLELRQEHVGEKVFQVMCYAEGVFPRPSMTLHIGQSEVNNSKVEVCEKNGLYDIKAVAQIPSLETPEEFSCELHIPQANYTVRKEAIYYPVYDDGALFAPLSLLGNLLVLILHLIS